MNSAGRTRSSFPSLEPLHGQPGKLLPEGETLSNGKHMAIGMKGVPG